MCSLIPAKKFIPRLHRVLSQARFCSPGHIPFNRNERFDPFFLVGSGRCGTTLLRRMLTGTDSVFIPPETRVIQDIVYFYKKNRNVTWLDLTSTSIGHFASHPDFDKYFPSVPFSDLGSQLRSVSCEQQSLAFILNAIYHHFRIYSGSQASRWGDKTPMYVFHLKALDALFPHAKYVHIMRDGVDVAASWMHARGDSSVEYGAKRWRSAVQSFRTFSKTHASQCFEVRYENLVSSQDTLRSICDFLDIPYDDAMATSLKHVGSMGDTSAEKHHTAVHYPVSDASVGKGRRSLSRAQLAVCQNLMGETLEENGYLPAAEV